MTSIITLTSRYLPNVLIAFFIIIQWHSFTFSFFNIFALFSASQALPPKWTSTALSIHEPRSTSSHIHDPFWAFPQLDEHAQPFTTTDRKYYLCSFLLPQAEMWNLMRTMDGYQKQRKIARQSTMDGNKMN